MYILHFLLVEQVDRVVNTTTTRVNIGSVPEAIEGPTSSPNDGISS